MSLHPFTYPINIISFFVSLWTLKMCTHFCHSGIFLFFVVGDCLCCLFICLKLLFWQDWIITSSSTLRITEINCIWKYGGYIVISRYLISFLNIPLYLKQTFKLHKNWKSYFPICNSTTISAVWIKKKVWYITCPIHMLKHGYCIAT